MQASCLIIDHKVVELQNLPFPGKKTIRLHHHRSSILVDDQKKLSIVYLSVQMNKLGQIKSRPRSSYIQTICIYFLACRLCLLLHAMIILQLQSSSLKRILPQILTSNYGLHISVSVSVSVSVSPSSFLCSNCGNLLSPHVICL
jgi:hypothetical protein